MFYNNYLNGLNLDHDSRQIILAKILNYYEHTNVNRIRRCDLIRISGIFLPRFTKAIKSLEKQELIKIDKKTTPRETWISILDFKASKHEIYKTVKRNAIQDLPVDRVLKPHDIILEDMWFDPRDVVLDDVYFTLRDSQGKFEPARRQNKMLEK